MAENRVRIIASVKDDASGKVSGIRDKLRNLGKEAKSGILAGVGLGAGMSAFNMFSSAVSGTVDYIKDAIRAASDLGETTSKAAQIIGQQALPELESWAEGAATAFGQSKQQALDAASTFAIFGKSAGLAGGDLVDFSTDLTELSTDLASFHNASPEEAIQAIGAALRGESEPIRRFGVLLNDATLKEQAFRLGLIKTTKEALTPQHKALAAQAEILLQTSDAQGDFERTSGGLANQQRILEAQFANVSAEIGEKLLPAMVELVSTVNEHVVPAITAVPGVLDDALEGMARFSDFGGGHMSDVEAIADALGISYMDARGKVVTANEEMGLSAAELRKQVEQQTDPTIKAAWANARASADALLRERPRLRTEAASSAAIVVDEIRAKHQSVRDAAYQSAVEYAKGLLDAQNEPKVAMDALMQVQAEALTRQAEINRLLGQLASTELANGLNDSREAVRAQAEATRMAIQNRLTGLGAWTWGNSVGTSFADGMSAAYGYVRTAAGTLAAATRNQIGINSEPSDPNSPLRGITRWGGNIVKTIAADMRSHVGEAQRAARAVAGALAPAAGSALGMSVAAPGLSLAAPGVTASRGGPLGGGGMVELHVHSYLDGREVAENVTRHQYYGQPARPSVLPRGT